MNSYKLLVRLFGEQCLVETTGPASSVVIKASKEVSSDSLQNPSDPDAGYCGHKGKGYQLQVMETWSEDKSQPNLITHVAVEAAHQSDANALIPAIEEAALRELAPTELLADSPYGSDDNLAQAKDRGVEVIAPAMGTVPEGISLADFEFSPDDEILSCPQGQKPQRIKTGKQGGKIVHFNKADCDHCPRQSECPVKRVKHSATLGYDAKSPCGCPGAGRMRRRQPSLRYTVSAPGPKEPCPILTVLLISSTYGSEGWIKSDYLRF